MKQNAAEMPVPNLQRMAAIAHGGARDHTGSVTVEPIPDFDLERTIFNTLEGALPRFVIRTRIAKEATWNGRAGEAVEAAYGSIHDADKLPPVSPELLRFLVEDCDFDVEHADGSFLDHLYFCYEYTAYHYPQQSSLVMLLHSILGTGTNTFAMTADKIPDLRALVSDSDWSHIEAFPSVLRLLYNIDLRRELWTNIERLDRLETIRFNRVIDNSPIVMSAKDFWVQLNYQLIHLVDFLPVSNWSVHVNDTAFIIFRDLYALLEKAGRLEARLAYQPPDGPRKLEDEANSFRGWLTTLIPVRISEKMAAKSVCTFSERIGHSIDYHIDWCD